MVVRNFDGPAGQMEDPNATGPRRQTSQPELSRDDNRGSARRELPVSVGLNLLTVGGTIGRDYRSPLKPPTASKSDLPSRAKSSSSRPAANSHVPRYNLKTIPPGSLNTVSKHQRPSAQHVPGSYRSEVLSTPAGSVGVATPTIDSQSVSEDQCCAEDLSCFGHETRMPSNVAESWRQATANSAAQAAGPEQETSSSHPHAEQCLVVEPAEPIRTLGMDYEHSHGASPAMSSPIRGGGCQAMREEEPADIDVLSSPADHEVQPSAVSYAGENTLTFNGPPISELLSQLPPISQVTITDLSGQQLTAKPSMQFVSSVNGSHSEHSKQTAPSNMDKDVTEVQSNRFSGNDHIEANIVEVAIHKYRSSDLLSTVSQKLSSLGKSMSSLSEFSLRSNPRVPSSHSSRKQEKLDLVNGGPRKYWMRQMLAGASGSKLPGSASNLTSRPSERQAHSMEAAERQGAASVPIDQLPNVSTDERLVALQPRRNTESFTRVIVDLESLLKEALVIAHQAAGEDHSDSRHALDQDSDNSSRYTLEVSDGTSTNSGGNDEEDNHSTFPRRLPLRISVSKGKNFGEGEAKLQNDLPENSRPRALETLSETQAYSVQGGSEPSRSTVGDVLSPKRSPDSMNPTSSYDWAYRSTKQAAEENETLYLPGKPIPSQRPNQEQRVSLVRAHKEFSSYGSRDTFRHNINARQPPAIQPRVSSLGLHAQAQLKEEVHPQKVREARSSDEDDGYDPSTAEFGDPVFRQRPAPQGRVDNEPRNRSGTAPGQRPARHDTIMPLPDKNDRPEDPRQQDERSTGDNVSLTNRHHFSIREPRGFSLGRSHRRAPIARDWSTPRKRWTATVACISTALMGLIIGIYAGEVPAIQYGLVDEHHYTILGNVVVFIGLAITTALFWPLPLLHGRKPYTLAALAILLPLQFPQAVVVSTQRSPYVATYRVGLLLPRAISGLIMGFANINFMATLLDLFGASLQSVHPHQEAVSINDVRRHGGGMGVWLGIWTFCYIGSLGVGFLIGAVIISRLNVAWGFWITIILIAIVLVLNVLAPEVRRSAYRRSMAEVRTGTDVSRRVAKGEVKMHLQSTGPIWWWEEVWAGHVLCIRMLKQPGFVVLSLYMGWIYGQVVIVIVVCLLLHEGDFH